MGSTTVQAPAPQSPAQVGYETLAAQLALAPEQYKAEAEYAPQYAALYQNVLRNTLLGTDGKGGLLSTYSQAAPMMGDLQAQLNAQQRAADIADVQKYGQQAVAAFQAANPQLQQIQNQMVSNALGAQAPVSMLGQAPSITAAQNPLIGLLGQQAQQQLAMGGKLSEYETSQLANQVASQMSMYGRQADPMAAASMALGLDSAQQQRMAAAQQFAGNVAGLQGQQNALDLQAQQAQAQLGYQYGTSNQQAQLSNAQYLQNILGTTANQLASTSVDPYAAILGRSGGMAQTAGAVSQAGGFPTSSQGFNPFSQDITSIMSGNQANQLAANVAGANASAAQNAGMMGAGGAIGAAAIVAL